MDGYVGDFQVQAGRTEEQVEVAERVEVAEVLAVFGDAFVIAPRQHLGAAECVAKSLR